MKTVEWRKTQDFNKIRQSDIYKDLPFNKGMLYLGYSGLTKK